MDSLERGIGSAGDTGSAGEDQPVAKRNARSDFHWVPANGPKFRAYGCIVSRELFGAEDKDCRLALAGPNRRSWPAGGKQWPRRFPDCGAARNIQREQARAASIRIQDLDDEIAQQNRGGRTAIVASGFRRRQFLAPKFLPLVGETNQTE